MGHLGLVAAIAGDAVGRVQQRGQSSPPDRAGMDADPTECHYQCNAGYRGQVVATDESHGDAERWCVAEAMLERSRAERPNPPCGGHGWCVSRRVGCSTDSQEERALIHAPDAVRQPGRNGQQAPRCQSN